MGMALFTGYVLDTTGSYAVLFAICAGAYVLALVLVHVLTPRLEPVGIVKAGVG
jgi:ACS family hexuronate transporter-like MFS transporter